MMGKRSRPRAYLLLARISNLPTVWTNVLAAHVAAGAALDTVPAAAGAMSCLYMGGMFLNDVCDATHDAVSRPDRPIPNGDVAFSEALSIGIGLLAVGMVLAASFLPHAVPVLQWGSGLMAAIVIYDLSHKGKWYGPIVMGLCRALVYCSVAAGVAGAVGVPVLIAAAIMWVYVIALTAVARAADLGYAVPWLLAGICLVDAAVIAQLGSPQFGAIAAAGFVLTLLLQRVVPGT